MDKVNLIPNSVKLEPEQQKLVELWAAAEQRKVSTMIRILVTEALQARGKIGLTSGGRNV